MMAIGPNQGDIPLRVAQTLLNSSSSHKEIARFIDISTEPTYEHLHRAIRNLRPAGFESYQDKPLLYAKVTELLCRSSLQSDVGKLRDDLIQSYLFMSTFIICAQAWVLYCSYGMDGGPPQALMAIPAMCSLVVYLVPVFDYISSSESPSGEKRKIRYTSSYRSRRLRLRTSQITTCIQLIVLCVLLKFRNLLEL